MSEGSLAIRRIAAVASNTSARQATDRAALRRVLSVARPWLAGQRTSAQEALRQRVEQHRRTGTPPELFRLMGLADREVPFNRLLGWALDPRTPMGRAALLAVCKVMSPALADELEAGETPVLRAEMRWPAKLGLTTEPDLLALGNHGILLIENKVLSGESGDGQYAGYLEGLHELARLQGGATPSAFLLARDQRSTPPGWDGFFTHVEFAELLRSAIPDLEGRWDRISLTLVARTLEQGPPVGGLLDRAGQLLAKEEPSMADIARMMAFQVLLHRSEEPWRDDGPDDLE